MDAKTQDALEAAGWVVRDAQDFLGLSDAEADFIDVTLALAEDWHARRVKGRHANDETPPP